MDWLTIQIVLASGKLVNANASSLPDLFRGLKGGMNNFGIITRFDLRTFAQGALLAGNIANSISDRDAVFRAFSNIAGAKEYDPYASLVTGLSYNSSIDGSWGISTSLAYTKPETNPAVYDELLAIPSTLNTLHITNLSTIANEENTPPLSVLYFLLSSTLCHVSLLRKSLLILTIMKQLAILHSHIWSLDKFDGSDI